MLYGDTESTQLPGDDGIIQEAQQNYDACKEWQGLEDDRAREDIKFANADPRNSLQWPDGIFRNRTGAGQERPCLTINITRTHNDLVINSMSKNAFGIKIRPTGGRASYESAGVMQSIIHRVEYISKFPTQRRKVAEHQVDGGIGYILIKTAFVSERSFDQDIYLKASRDPCAVYLDPWITEPDGSDANFGFIFERLSRKTFNRKYPKYKDKVGQAPLDTGLTVWLSDKEILVARYYRRKDNKDLLVGYKQSDGTDVVKLRSEIIKESGREIFDVLMMQIKNGQIDGRTREVKSKEVEWFQIAGDKIVERGDWPGQYIPICRCVGREAVIDGTLDRKGLTRNLIDAQRMLNYNASGQVEFGALQTKAQWLGPARAFEGQEQWKNANIENAAWLQFNDVDEEASTPELQKIAAPIRIDPPRSSPVFSEGMQNAERQIMMISGQYQAQLGEDDKQSASSGKAINERQQQSDTATYHFPEHQGDMLRFIGVQLLDLIPKVYDTKRTLQVRDEEGKKRWLMIDPDQSEVIRELEHDAEDEEAVKMAFNPQIGEYECVSDPGPDYATQRQEGWNALTIILQQNMALVGVIGDLLFQYGDFPGAEKIKDRLEKEIKATKPYLFDNAKDPALIALQQQNQQLVKLHSELIVKLADADLKLRGREERRDIEAFKADTERFKAEIEAIKNLVLTPQQRANMDHELEVLGHQHVYDMISQANEPEVEAKQNGTGGQ